MRSPAHPVRVRGRSGFASVLLANLIPLVGVVQFGWAPATLVVIYAVEVLLSILLAGFEALFARRHPPEERDGVLNVSNAELTAKRGSVEVVPWLPPIYPRNVPFAATVIGGGAWFSAIAVVALSETFPLGEVILGPEVAIGVVALFVGQLVETGREYVLGRRYEDVSAFTVIETPGRRAFFLAFVLLTLPGLGDAAVGGTVVLATVVVVKLFVEWSTYRATHGDDPGRLARWLAGPEETAPPPAPVRVPSADPSVRVRADRTAVLLTGVLRTLARAAPFYVSSFAAVWLIAVGVLGRGELTTAETAVVTSTVAILLVAALAVKTAGFYLRYGPLEYRRRGERVVAYDTLLDEPQWSAPIRELRDVSVVANRLPDRAFGSRTIRATTGWGAEKADRCLCSVADPETVVDAFELPVGSVELKPLDGRFVAGAVLFGGGVVLAGIASLVAPRAAPWSWVHVVLPLPFFAVVLGALWERAYRDANGS